MRCQILSRLRRYFGKHRIGNLNDLASRFDLDSLEVQAHLNHFMERGELSVDSAGKYRYIRPEAAALEALWRQTTSKARSLAEHKPWSID